MDSELVEKCLCGIDDELLLIRKTLEKIADLLQKEDERKRGF
jgi:hypothetical protein